LIGQDNVSRVYDFERAAERFTEEGQENIDELIELFGPAWRIFFGG
jgi:hypothetical protein